MYDTSFFFFFFKVQEIKTNQGKFGKIKDEKKKKMNTKKKKKIVAQGTKESDKSHISPGCKGDNFEKNRRRRRKNRKKSQKENDMIIAHEKFVHTRSPMFSLHFSSSFREIIFWWVQG